MAANKPVVARQASNLVVGSEPTRLQTTRVPALQKLLNRRIQGGFPPEHRIDYVCVLESGGLTHVVPPPDGMRICAQQNTRIGNLRSGNPLMAFLVALQNLVLASWTDPVRLGDYLGEESLGQLRYPSEMLPALKTRP